MLQFHYCDKFVASCRFPSLSCYFLLGDLLLDTVLETRRKKTRSSPVHSRCPPLPSSHHSMSRRSASHTADLQAKVALLAESLTSLERAIATLPPTPLAALRALALLDDSTDRTPSWKQLKSALQLQFGDPAGMDPARLGRGGVEVVPEYCRRIGVEELVQELEESGEKVAQVMMWLGTLGLAAEKRIRMVAAGKR